MSSQRFDFIEIPSGPLVPREVKNATERINALSGARLRLIRTDQVGDTGGFAFSAQGDAQASLDLPLISSSRLASISAPTAAGQFNVEQAFTISATPTQAEVQAILDWARTGFRHYAQTFAALQQATFPQ